MLNINLTVEESYSLQLEELGNAGYSWNYSVEEGADIIDISQQSLSAPPVTQAGNSMPDTFEAKIVFTIKAIKPGTARVRFFLHRVWEKYKPPLKEQLLKIEVSNKN
jgi:predicted secreted protein